MQMQSFLRGAMAVTAVATVMAAAPAHALVVYSGPQSIDVPDNIDGVYVNLITGASASSPPAGWDINPYSALGGQFNLWGATTTTWLTTSGAVAGPYVLSPGTSISSAGSFNRPGGGTDVGAEVALGAANLFGVQFLNEGTGVNNYGWVEITFGGSAGERTITGWAYDDAGAGVLAGVVPEPGTYALMLAGLVAVGGIAARRRKV